MATLIHSDLHGGPHGDPHGDSDASRTAPCSICGCTRVQIDYVDCYLQENLQEHLEADPAEEFDEGLAGESDASGSASLIALAATGAATSPSLELAECPRCRHRWTRTLVARGRASGVSVPAVELLPASMASRRRPRLPQAA